MKKSNITGWKNVFSFTLIQTLKNKAYIISFLLFLTMALISMPIINMIFPDAAIDLDSPSPIKKVYVNNQAALTNIDFSGLLTDNQMKHITFEAMTEDYDIITNRIKENENDSVVLTITENEGIYSLDFAKADSGPVKDSSIALLGNALTEQFEILKIDALGITKEQAAIINANVDATVSMIDVNGTPVMEEDTSISSSEYWLIYIILFIVLMVNTLASTQIATSIVTEKSTRVVEYLLISVKPLALMIGKIFAMLIAVLLQIVSTIAVLFISNTISARISPGANESVLSKYLPSGIFQNLNIVNILFCLILIILGFIFYATLAGLAGSTVSKLEELNEGLMLFTFTNLIGAYIGLGAANVLIASGENAYTTFSLIFPLSSPFILPGAILIGKADIPIIAAAVIILTLSIILLFRFVAKVYETLILHNGSKIKLKALIKLSKTVS